MIVKMIAVLLAGCLGFSACGSGGTDTSAAFTTTPEVTTEAAIITEAPIPEATTVAPTITEAETPTETEASTETETPEETEEPETTKKETEAVKVWITEKGKKYHRKSSCSNMKSPWQVTIDEAKKMGRGPCSKCY